MCYHKNGGIQFFFCLQKAVNDCPRRTGIQITGWFIRQNYLRIIHKSSGNGGALFFSAGNISGVFIFNMGNTEYFTKLCCPFFHGRVHMFTDNSGNHDIFKDSQTIQQKKILKNKAQFFVPYFGNFRFV